MIAQEGGERKENKQIIIYAIILMESIDIVICSQKFVKAIFGFSFRVISTRSWDVLFSDLFLKFHKKNSVTLSVFWIFHSPEEILLKQFIIKNNQKNLFM